MRIDVLIRLHPVKVVLVSNCGLLVVVLIQKDVFISLNKVVAKFSQNFVIAGYSVNMAVELLENVFDLIIHEHIAGSET